MLDTIVLTLSKNMYYISEPDMFEPSAKLILGDNTSLGSRGYFPAKQNPSKRELQNGFYKPRLSLTNRFNHTGNQEATLKIELSLPKLLFGNNFDELTLSDFDPVTTLLISRLKEMGVMVFTKVMENAPVSAIHYSKNIPLTDGSTPHYLISKIKEANIKLSLDVNQTDFRNDGHSYKWHCNSYEVAFYDKLKDLRTAKISEKRALESDNSIQLNLFNTQPISKPFEVLRMEVRLGTRRKIRQILKSIGLDIEPTFKSLFNSQISQTILLCYLHEMESRRPTLLDYQNGKPKELLADLIINNPKLGPKRTLQLFGLKQAMELVGMREIRVLFNKYTDRSWYRLVADANKIKLPIAKDIFGTIRTHLTEFKPLKLVDFQDQMLNNDKYT